MKIFKNKNNVIPKTEWEKISFKPFLLLVNIDVNPSHFSIIFMQSKHGMIEISYTSISKEKLFYKFTNYLCPEKRI